jgi:hypothetical protein
MCLRFTAAHMTLNSLSVFRIASAISALCGVVLLFLPIVWMEIGPNGIVYYGPQVPDIYIYGGAITGKDLSFTPILIAMLLQFAFIMIGIFLSVVNCIGEWKRPRAIGATWFQTSLLLFFPYWMSMYVGGVICNSDGAASDLTVHYGSGVVFYILLFVINIFQLFFLHVVTRKRKAKLLPA